MSNECNHDCGACQEECDEKSFLAPMNAHSHVKKVIGIVSGKGGVGKSSITSLLAVLKQREGHNVAILDGDITGPSIGKTFGVDDTEIYSNGKEIIPAQTAHGMKIMSTNLLLEHPEDPVVWRGPILGIVENMSYVKCPDCGKKIFVFGKSHLEDVIHKYDLNVLGQIPLDSELTKLSDMGMIEEYESDWLTELNTKVREF